MINAKEAKALSNSKTDVDRILEALDGDIRVAAEDGKTTYNVNTEDYSDQVRKELTARLQSLGYIVTNNSWSITLNWSMA